MQKFNRKDKKKLFSKILGHIRKKDQFIENYSIIRELKGAGKVNDNLLTLLRSLPIEDIIAMKLELSLMTFGSRLVGISAIKRVPEIYERAILKYALSVSNKYIEVAHILGLKSRREVVSLMRKYKILKEEGNE
jgi:hypothetical protein